MSSSSYGSLGRCHPALRPQEPLSTDLAHLVAQASLSRYAKDLVHLRSRHHLDGATLAAARHFALDDGVTHATFEQIFTHNATF
ncbi:MAG: hypothetical protein ACPGWR_28550 [Ardenticatenaceae bacterium]